MEIFEKEKSSHKPAYYFVNHLNERMMLDFNNNVYRLYETKYQMAYCFREYPVPFEFQRRRDFNIEFEFIPDEYSISYRQYSNLIVTARNYTFKLMYTSLYKVDKLIKRRLGFILP